MKKYEITARLTETYVIETIAPDAYAAEKKFSEMTPSDFQCRDTEGWQIVSIEEIEDGPRQEKSSSTNDENP